LVLAVLFFDDLQHDWISKEHGKLAQDIAIKLGLLCILGPGAFGISKNGKIIFETLGSALVALGFLFLIWRRVHG